MTKLQKLAQLELARRAIARELAEEEMETVAGGEMTLDEQIEEAESNLERCFIRANIIRLYMRGLPSGSDKYKDYHQSLISLTSEHNHCMNVLHDLRRQKALQTTKI